MDALDEPLFGDPDVAACLGGEARLQRMLDVEAALAEAEAALGLIPAAAAAGIRACARVALFDRRAIARDAAQDGNLAIPLVRHLTREVATHDPAAARYVHWGATSQDIIDTALVLQLDAAMPVILDHVTRAMAAAAEHAAHHIDTVMPGRTWLQQATPITFGLKAAGWLDALMRSHARITSAWSEVRVLQFGGATGTLAAVAPHGAALAADLATRLGLRAPDLPWHTHRDRLAHLAATLGIATGTCGKIARDLALLAQTEIAEVHEAPAGGRGGSSTMPHKQNPVGAAAIITAATRAPGLVATILQAMPQEQERGLGGWQAEGQALADLVLASAGAARVTADVLRDLAVDPARMRANLDVTHGLTLAEAVSMALAQRVGKQEAHALVEAASRRAAAERLPLEDVLAADPRVTAHLTRDDIVRLLTPERYLGSARTFVERVLARYEQTEPASTKPPHA